jgi:hypothetical protein
VYRNDIALLGLAHIIKMSKSNSLRKAEQLEIQKQLIAQKKEQIAKKKQNLKLLESFTRAHR